MGKSFKRKKQTKVVTQPQGHKNLPNEPQWRPGEILKLDTVDEHFGSLHMSYYIAPEYTPVDILKAIARHPDVIIESGERKDDHDVGCDSSFDHSYYNSVEQFIASGDFERHSRRDPSDHIHETSSDYIFYGTFKGIKQPLSLAFFGACPRIEETQDLGSCICSCERAKKSEKSSSSCKLVNSILLSV